MSEKRWTNEQLQAINLKGANILVSAAAGSGKTSVLVERIINKIINEGVDIDKILVVTFTNAAASEMRERLMNKIYEKIDEEPNNQNLQRQLLLINKANISTIHSFCLNVIRNNFFEIGISNNFRVADDTEIEILKQEVIEDIFEEKYEKQDEGFLKLLQKYTSYKDDINLKNLIIKVYEFIQSDPFPEKWLENAVEEYHINEEDFSKTKWGNVILNEAKDIINDCITKLKVEINDINLYPNLIDFKQVLNMDLIDLQEITTNNWDEAFKFITLKEWQTWPRKSKISEEEKEVKEKAKSIRDLVKSNFTDIQKIINCNSKDAIENINEMYETLKDIRHLVLEFYNEFSTRKRERNIVDFNDIEHLALKILVDENGNPTEIAKKYDFNEIEIDEYQDSNSVQEYILQSVSNGNNVFMVGDVKQSIYKFRQANPKLFMQKYNEYVLPKEKIESDTKILLYKNFRSRENVLDITNLVFSNIMSEKLGEIEYTDDEKLNLGANFDETNIDCTTELNIIETDNNEEDDDVQEVVENAALEARLVAKKIKELHSKNIAYKDMTILLRSPKSIANIFERELMEEQIPVFSDISTDYLNTIEIDTIMSLLKIIDNPLQDIPLVTILRSEIGGFTDNDLIEVRLVDRESSFYKALEKAKISDNINNNLKEKISEFLTLIEEIKVKQNELPLDELIWYIYTKTGYYNYVGLMPDGTLRQANLKKLFEKAKEYEKISFKGLFNFILFMEKVGTSNNDLNAARVIGENDDVVRIMSIHKSKGLEFPIVFLCGVNKKFNLRDMNEKIILDNQMGIGMNYILDGIEFPTLTKEAIKIKTKKESISEEMRVLYVALTRAKDKIIIVGTSNKVTKKLQEKKEELNKYNTNEKNKKINYKLIEKYKSYLDWLELVYEYNSDSKMKLNIINKIDLMKEAEQLENINETKRKKEEIIKNLDKVKINEERYKNIDNLLKYDYRYKSNIDLPTKTSVTALKEQKKESKKVPIFIENKQSNSARKGTLVHLLLSKLTKETTIKEIEILLNELIKNKAIKQEEKNLIDLKIFEDYLSSNLYKELLEAKEIKRETPFYLNINSSDIYPETNEKILVQGVIDLYYINKNNELILVDYKTDYVENKKEEYLIEKYKIQLYLYQKALEKALNRKVNHIYIYSTYLNKQIEIYK